MRNDGDRDIRAELWPVVGALLWAANYPVVKYSISGIDTER